VKLVSHAYGWLIGWTDWSVDLSVEWMDRRYGAGGLLLWKGLSILADAVIHTLFQSLWLFLVWLSLPWLRHTKRKFSIQCHVKLSCIVWCCCALFLIAAPTASAMRRSDPHTVHQLVTQQIHSIAAMQAVAQPKHFQHVVHTGAAVMTNHALDTLQAFLPFGVDESASAERCTRDPDGLWLLGNHPDASKAQMLAMSQALHACKRAFAYSNAELPGYCGCLGPVKIELIHNKPIFQAARKYSELERGIIADKCRDMWGATIIEESDVRGLVKYASNATLPVKKDEEGVYSEARFCLDFVAVNEATEPDKYPTPLPEDIFAKAGHAKFFSKLDMRAGYFQLPIDPSCRDVTAFWWGNRLFRFTRLPMGLKNATAVFQKTMDTELRLGGCSDFASAFVDDVLVYSNDMESHIQHVTQVLDVLHKVGLRVHPGKSVFATDCIEYLGHNVSASGISPTAAKVSSIAAMPEPQSVSDLRAHLGFLNYYRCYIPRFAELCRPLNDMLKKDVNWKAAWGEAQRTAFRELKEAMCAPGVGLHHPDLNLPFEVHTDWSIKGLSAILMQRDAEGNPKLIAASSRSCNEHEQRYSSWQGELLAAVYGCRIFRPYLHGRKFTLKTDHRPLCWLLTCKTLSAQHTRWLIMLQDLTFDIVHVPGVEHVIADVPSRFPPASTLDPTGAKLEPDGPIPRHRLPPVYLADGTQMSEEQLRIEASKIDASYFKAVHRAAPAVCMAHLPPDDAWLEDDVTVRHAVELYTCDRERVVTPGRMDQMDLLSSARQWVRDSLPVDHLVPMYLPGSYVHALDPSGCRTTAQLCTKTIGSSFWKAAFHEGVVMYEPFGGMCNGLLSALRCGIVIKRYIYSDTCPNARRCAEQRLKNLSAAFPLQLPQQAISDAFSTLPMDVYRVSTSQLAQLCRKHQGSPWLVVGGWECQDLSPAGKCAGLGGPRSRSFYQIVHIIGALQQLAPDRIAYVLENTAFQHNWKSASIANTQFEQVCRVIGQPVLLDAARVGSSAHRLRNFWTNLGSQVRLQHTLDGVMMGPKCKLSHIVGPGVELAEVLHDDPAPYFPCNQRGQPRRAWPTFVSVVQSTAFRPGRPGAIYTHGLNGRVATEPSACMREMAMGWSRRHLGPQA